MIKSFRCGFCKDNKKDFVSTRKGLRMHLKEEHIKNSQLTNSGYVLGKGYTKQDWWLEEPADG